MNAGVKNQSTDSDDIDLLLLVERSIVFFKTYKWIFIIAIALGLLLGFLRWNSLPRIYKSRMIAQSRLLTNQDHIQIVNNWNDLLNRGEHAALAAIFECPQELFTSLKKIKADEIQKVFTPANPNGFTIEVMVTDNAILGPLQQGIVKGFENSDYVKERLAAKKERYRELIDLTGNEVKKLDSTKKIMENIIGGKSSSASAIIIDGSSINKQLIEMNEKLLFFREELEFSNAIEVLQGFNSFRKPIGPRLMVLLFLGVAVFLTLAYIYALFSSINKKLKSRSRLRDTINAG